MDGKAEGEGWEGRSRIDGKVEAEWMGR